ncbi:hypothetical protein B0H16DRAFT_1768950 [Mycena metata]|uniref:Reverse transcriptase n=1 Tax=Mycena metata TaxID=1033252 RepID=A0AAD7JUM9_9AGAR|nr:hypothetical protein B0H16DRAFT_1768950 [Mycena metata]
MFECPGVLISKGSQRFFTQTIRGMRSKPHRKSTFINLDRTRCAIQEISGYTPTDATIWRSVRSNNLQRLTREFLWKCIHNTFRVGNFWSHIDHLEIIGRCHGCQVPDTVWQLTRHLWNMKFAVWPTMKWGLILGCNLVKFKSTKGLLVREQGRLFTILVSIAWHLIWNLRVARVIRNPDMPLNEDAIHNQWLKMVNAALQRDRILTNKARFGTLALNKQTVLNTWSGLLMDEDSLPDDWIFTKGVLVGIRPKAATANGIG